jgi:hypothetical protein
MVDISKILHPTNILLGFHLRYGTPAADVMVFGWFILVLRPFYEEIKNVGIWKEMICIVIYSFVLFGEIK